MSFTDTLAAMRFLKMLVTPFDQLPAFDLGIIDSEGNLLKKKKERTSKKERDAYDTFTRLVINIKRHLRHLPLMKGRLGSLAAALYLIKEDFGVSERKIKQGLNEYGVDFNDFLSENTQWFMLEDRELSPGVYTLSENKVLCNTYEEIAFRGDRIRISDESFPIGDIFGLDIYEAIHMPTNQKIFVTAGEIRK